MPKREIDPTALELNAVREQPLQKGIEQVDLETNAGTINCRLHRAPGAAAVVWVGGAGGGLDGPAGGMYPRLAGRLVKDNISSLRLDYRFPNELASCVLDTLIGVAYLDTLGIKRVAVVGHSFGGAVVIIAGTESDHIVAVAALSSQTYGTSRVDELAHKPLLLMHGQKDEVLPDYCSRDIYSRAQNPKKMLLYPGCGHGLDACRDAIDHDLTEWLEQVLK